jgi:hypothetical protein
MLILCLQLAVNLLYVALKLLEPQVLPLKVALEGGQFLLPAPLLVLHPPLVVAVGLLQLLLQVRHLRLLDSLALQLKVQDVRDVTDHRGQLQDRVVLIRGEVKLQLQVQGGSQFRVRFEFVTDVIQEVVGFNRQFVVVLL